MKRKSWLLFPSVLWLILFFLIPMVFVAILSFWRRGTYGQVMPAATLDNYLRFFDPLYIKVLWDTLAVSLITTVACLVFGYPLAYLISAMEPRWQRIWLLLVMVPFWINFLVRSYAWVVILRSQGLVNTFLLELGLIDKPLQLLYNPGAVLLGMIYTFLPFMVLPVYVSLEKLDQRLIEAAYDLGATPWKAFFRVLLPQSLPGIVAGSILVFVPSLGMFVVPDVMGGAKSALIGNVIQNQFLSARDWPFGAALSMILIVLSLLLIYLYNRALNVRKGNSE